MAASPADVGVARRQLGLSSSDDAKIPAAYLQELVDMLRIYPHDTNYRVMPNPKKGFGEIFCEEDGCLIEIPMERNPKAPHGGMIDGIGSLASYKRHISLHPTHTKNRNARVTALRSNPSTPVKREPSSNTLPLTPSPLLRRRVSTGASLAKAEPMESTIPRKRQSVAAFPLTDQSTMGSSPAKKVKKEDSTTLPFGSASDNRATTPKPIDIEDIRARIAELQTDMGSTIRLRDNISRKRRKTKADLTRLRKHEEALERLKEQSDALRASLPQHSPIRRAPSSKALVGPKNEPSLPMIPKEESNLPPAFHNPAFAGAGVFAGANAIASGSNHRLPGLPGLPKLEDDEDTDMDVDPQVGQNAILNRVTGQYIPYVAPVANADAFDGNGDFHGRGRDTFQGPTARADDIDKFLRAAGNSEAFDENVDVNECLKKLGLHDLTALLPGMEVPLMPHQVIGVSWMVEKEADKIASGGILGDDMGLGKTVQMIAIMLKNKSRDSSCKTNLILTPKALLSQWQLEIELKTNSGLTCLIYHGSGKVKRKQDLLQYDVVLTTFQTMANEWPDFESEQKKKAKASRKSGNSSDGFLVADSEDDDDHTRPKKKQKGLLFEVDFYRVILDEGHNIRNKRNRMSRAVTELNAKYRWVLTGTPIINSLADVYGYFRFLRLRPWYDWQEFNGHIAKLEKKNPSLAMTRLQAIFKACLMRRMKDTMLDGKRLIELPPKTISLTKLDFMKEERDIYKMVEAATQAKFNRYLRAGTVLKNYSQVLVLLLRLRQICSHPALVQENGTTFISSEEDEDNWNPDVRDELIRARDIVSAEFVSKMKKQLKEATLQRIKAEKESADAVAEIEECPICFDPPTSAAVTPCCHIFCRECLENVLSGPAPAMVEGEPAKYRENERACPACRDPISKDVLFDLSIFEPTDAELFPKQKTVVFKSKKRAAGKGKGKAPAVTKFDDSEMIDIDAMDTEEEKDEDEDEGDMSDFIVDDDDDDDADYTAKGSSRRKPKGPSGGTRRKPFVVLDSDEEEEPEVQEVVFGKKKREEHLTPEALQFKFLASTKMKHMMAQILKLFEEKPNEKILIISQWTSCLDLVSEYLKEKSVIHVKYQGDMSMAHRETSVRLFMSRDKERVMLLSLKCGGVGLNLTRANNVISLDLGWSQAVESQAFDRVHRLGQNLPVVVERLVIQDTVEDRILALQERKQNLADGSLGEGSGKKIGRLSVKELASLFGLDARGRVLQ